ncbi:hypothetical protein [Aeromonas salmonicida]|nr:hypothetical protein [Aeromonas salmonicida]
MSDYQKALLLDALKAALAAFVSVIINAMMANNSSSHFNEEEYA